MTCSRLRSSGLCGDMVGVPGCANSAVTGLHLGSPGCLPLFITIQKLLRTWMKLFSGFRGS